jgi:FixJ family two-component response regulator
MKGDEFLTIVHQKFPHIAKIMLSGQADTDAIEQVKSVAQGTFIAKPWKKEDLGAIISDYLGNIAK